MENKKKKFNYDLLSVGFIYAVALIFFLATFSIKDPNSQIFPRIMCGLAVLFGTLFLIKILRGKPTNPEGSEPNFDGAGRAFIMGALLLLYIGMNFLAGYYIATAIFMPVGMLYLGQRNWKAIVGVTGGLLLVIWLFFDVILGMVMPTGILFL